MTDAEWAAEIEGERIAKERFHAMRKYNTPRRVRQEAWAVLQTYYWQRLARAARMHPIDPSHRWWDFNDSAPKGWSCPAMRTLEPEEIDALFPNARAALATQCDAIPAYRVVYDMHDHKLRLSVPMTPPRSRHMNVTWLPQMGVWRRYQTHVKSKPYRSLEPELSSSVATESRVLP